MTDISHSFVVDAINKTANVDVSINVLKRREIIAYKTTLPTTNTGISFVNSATISANNNLSIADRSISLSANRILNTGYTTITNTKTFSITLDDFVVTDVFLDSTNTVTPIPLFYKHVLDSDKLPREIDGSISSGYTLQSVTILDQYMSPTSSSNIKIDFSNGVIYTNLLPEYISHTDYTIYFVKYTIRELDGSLSEYIDLLNIEKIYQLATFDDLDENLENIKSGRKVYLLDDSGDQFTVTLPVVGTYAFQPLGTGRIRLLMPSAISADDQWFVRISNSVLYTTINKVLYKYRIGEFLTQNFSPSPPYKVTTHDTSTPISKTLIKLDHPNVYQDNVLGLYVSIVIDKANGTAKAAYTTDPALEGSIASNGMVYKKWDTINQTGIKSIDHYTGIVQIGGIELLSTDEITSSYYYTESKYEYSTINFNPLLNHNSLIGHVSIFVDPDSIISNKSQTLYFLHADDTGKIIDSDHPYFNNITGLWDSGSGGKSLYYETLPDFVTSGSDIDFFVHNYTVEGDTSLPTFEGFLILGDITVAPSISLNAVSTIDSRNRGGGILSNQIDDALDVTQEVNWIWDYGYWDGLPFPGDASYFIEVPAGILDGAGGTLTQNKVREIVSKHTAAGVYPIIKAYGVEIGINNIMPTESGIMIEWESYGY